MASLPDAPQRRVIASCTTCHTLQRIVELSYKADDFMALVPRMMRYGAMSKPNHPQVAPDRSPTSAPKGDVLRNFAEYLGRHQPQRPPDLCVSAERPRRGPPAAPPGSS